MALTAGSRLGPYEIVAAIGAGGMGEVYRARDPRLGRDVAVKVLPAAFALDAERLARFQREARVIAALSHPNILAVYDVGAHEGLHYLVSELVEGASLRARLTEGTVPARKAVEYAVQIAQGLAAAHEKGVTHRDLKPDNLFLSKDGRVKILDFGLAYVEPTAATADDQTSPTAAGMVLGTVGYMSPEQVRGQPVDHRSDIFSFGAVLYEMLTGQRAFRRDTSAETMTSILKEEPPDLSASGKPVPPGLDRIVRHCLEKNPEERFQSASDLAFDLASLSGSSTTGAQAVRAPVSRRAVTAALAMAALAALGVLSFLAGRQAAPVAEQPRFQRLTFRDGYISAARFAPDGQTVVYSAQWDNGPTEIFTTRLEFPESRPLGLKESVVYAVSGSGEVLIGQRATVSRFGIQTGTLSAVPLAGGSPRELVPDVRGADVGGGAASFAVVKDVGDRYRLEFPAGKLLFETSGYISHARVSPDGQRVAFMDHPVRHDDRGWVSVVDRGGGKKRLTQEWAGSQQGLAWHPSGKEIWFTASDVGPNMSLRAVNLEGKERVVLRTAGRLKLHDIAPDGRVLLTREAWRDRIMAYTDGQPRPLDLSWLDGSGVTDISPDGSAILFDEWAAAAGPMYAVCLRKLDGSPPVRLGQGGRARFSPDGKWALVMFPVSPVRYALLPIGAGEARELPLSNVAPVGIGAWFPDGSAFLFRGTEPGRKIRTYRQDIQGGAPRAVTPEGVVGFLVSPDGKTLVARGPEEKWILYSLANGDRRSLAGLPANHEPIAWSADGKNLFSFALDPLALRVHRLSLATGTLEPWREHLPHDSAGVLDKRFAVITPDGKTSAYSYTRVLSDLYVVEGLK